MTSSRTHNGSKALLLAVALLAPAAEAPADKYDRAAECKMMIQEADSCAEWDRNRDIEREQAVEQNKAHERELAGSSARTGVSAEQCMMAALQPSSTLDQLDFGMILHGRSSKTEAQKKAEQRAHQLKETCATIPQGVVVPERLCTKRVHETWWWGRRDLEACRMFMIDFYRGRAE